MLLSTVTELVNSESLNMTASFTDSEVDSAGLARHSQAPDVELTTRLSYSVVGAPGGRPVLLLLGLGSHRYFAALWHELALKNNLRILLPDRPGKGLTTRPQVSLRSAEANPFSESFPALVKRWLKEIGIEQVTLMGHSMGCVHALWLAKKLPEILDRRNPIVLLGPWIMPSWDNDLVLGARILRRGPSILFPLVAKSMITMIRLISHLPVSVRQLLLPSTKERQVMISESFSYLFSKIAEMNVREGNHVGIEGDLVAAVEKYYKIPLKLEELRGIKIEFVFGDMDKMVKPECMIRVARRHGFGITVVENVGHDILLEMETVERVFAGIAEGSSTSADD